MRTLAHFLALPLVVGLMIGCDTATSDPPAKPVQGGTARVDAPGTVAAKVRKKKEPGLAPAGIPRRKDL